MEEGFKVAAVGIVTYQGEVLLGKKTKGSGDLAGQWHLPGGLVDKDETPEEALEREIKEETGLEGEVFQLVEVNSSLATDIGPDDVVRTVYHIEADSRQAEAGDDLEKLKWIDPENFEDEVGSMGSQYLEESERLNKFFRKLQKLPST